MPSSGVHKPSRQVHRHAGIDVVIELERRKGCLRPRAISEKHGLTCGNVEFGYRPMVADLGLERISCGIPAQSWRGSLGSVRVPRTGIYCANGRLAIVQFDGPGLALEGFLGTRLRPGRAG